MGTRIEALKRIAKKEAELGNKQKDFSTKDNVAALYYSWKSSTETYYTSYRY
jgi:hypothetical protein